MSAARPSNHPLGYWLASTLASMPSHAWPDGVSDFIGDGMQVNPDQIPGMAPPPVPDGGGALPDWLYEYTRMKAPQMPQMGMGSPMPMMPQQKRGLF